jgi:hypothetical protein
MSGFVAFGAWDGAGVVGRQGVFGRRHAGRGIWDFERGT